MSTASRLDSGRGDLRRFLDAQEAVYEQVLKELRSGEKQSHWMWFIFPQLKALGRSSMAVHFGLEDLAEASDYWSDRVLGPRLKECVMLVVGIDNRAVHDIFGSPDDLKLCSCLTLFECATSDQCFGDALDRLYAGRRDEATERLLTSR